MPDLATLAGIALKTSLLIGAAALLSLALRGQSAALRHVVWTSALALCVLMPAVVLLLPSHAIATLPADAPTLTLPRLQGKSEVVWIVWILGSIVFLVRELLSAYGLARWLRHAHAVKSPRWTATLAKFECGVRVLESRHIASPCTWGVLTPVLLLPTSGDSWSESARHHALVHELAHVQRRDTISALIARLACVLHWYNPLVWLAAVRARNLQEQACDDAVLRAGATPSDYAQFLLDVAARMSGMDRPGSTAVGMAHSALRGRIVAILDPQARRAHPGRSRVVASCGTLLAIALLLGMASVHTLPEPPPIATLPVLPKLPIRPILPIRPTLPLPPVPVVPPVPVMPVNQQQTFALSSAP
jgi:beta-lactamase regulating signal transducer with metallopeptidase domain